MNYESRFVAKILGEGSLNEAYEKGFSTDFFLTDNGKSALEYVVGHYSKHGKAPSLERFKQDNPGFVLEPCTDSVGEIVEDLRARAIYNTLETRIREMAVGLQGAKKNPRSLTLSGDNALSLLRQTTLEVEKTFSRAQDTLFTSKEFRDDYFRYYNEKKGKSGIIGVPFMWETVNKTTLGAQEEDLIGILGRPGLGKTNILVANAVFNWKHYLRRVLFISNEVKVKSLADRYIANQAKIPYTALRSATLDEVQYKKLEQALEELASSDVPFIVSGSDDDMGACGISAIEAKIERYQPQIVYVDGAYLLKDDMGASTSYQAVSNVARGLKRLAKRVKLPIIISWQLNRSGNDDTSSVAMTDVLSQDSDVLIKLDRTEDMRLNHTMRMFSIKTRESAPFDILINFDFAKMDFSEIPSIDEVEFEEPKPLDF